MGCYTANCRQLKHIKYFLCVLDLFYGVLRVLGRKIPPKMFLISRFLRTGFGHASDFHGEERSFME